jgi:flagellar biosynthesis GTPase FlhF
VKISIKSLIRLHKLFDCCTSGGATQVNSVRIKGVRIVRVLALLFSLGASTAVAENRHTLTKKELTALLATAKTPADQQKLAAYRREKTRQQRRLRTLPNVPMCWQHSRRRSSPIKESVADARATTAASQNASLRKRKKRKTRRRTTRSPGSALSTGAVQT